MVVRNIQECESVIWFFVMFNIGTGAFLLFLLLTHLRPGAHFVASGIMVLTPFLVVIKAPGLCAWMCAPG